MSQTPFFAMSKVRSIIPFETPRSLSYHENTLAKFEPRTWVVVASNVLEAGAALARPPSTGWTLARRY
jgi:hypothetical protein